MIFGQGERQSWDDPSKDIDKTNKNELNETRQMLNKSEKSVNK